MMRFILLFVLVQIAICAIAFNVHTTERFSFKNISVEDGLSNLNITSFCEDDLGYIWIGTRRGLNRFNGYEFTYFFYDADDESSLAANNINAIYHDGKGKIFIGSQGGLNCYDNNTGEMTRLFPGLTGSIVSISSHQGIVYLASLNNGIYRFCPDSMILQRVGSNWDQGLMIGSIFFDRNGVLWTALLNGHGLALYDYKSDVFNFFKNNLISDNHSINSVNSIKQISDKNLMLATKHGLFYFNLENLVFTDLPDFAELTAAVGADEVTIVFEYPEGQFWAGTKNYGLFSYNHLSAKLFHYYNDVVEAPIIHTYNTYYIDRQQNLWMGSFDSGIDVYFPRLKRFNFDNDLNKLTRYDFITNILKDHDDHLVITTRKRGFYRYDISERNHKVYTPENSGLRYPHIRSITIDSQNRYWIGMESNLQIFNVNQNSFIDVEIPHPISSITTMHYTNGKVFAGTSHHGIMVFDMNGNVIFRNLIYGQNIPRIMQLNDSQILFISYAQGLYYMDINNFNISKIAIDGLVNSQDVYGAVTAHTDSDGHIWLGTYNFGLIRIDKELNSVISFGIDDGLPSTDVLAIEEDELNNLWLSTSYGLARIDRYSYDIRSYSFKDGLKNYQFHEKASYKDDKGVIYFGGNSGLTYFDPEEMKSEYSEPPVVILENFQVSFKDVTPGSDEKLLQQAVAYINNIKLNHTQKNFSIGYVAFDYLNADALEYYYMMEGLDNEWNYVGKQRQISFSNLRRGLYTFKVKALNNEGLWSDEPAILTIRVVPAPWFSNIAWVIYCLVLFSVVLIFSRMYIKATLAEERLGLEKSEHEREKEINNMKRRFFTNIAHEFRTPLTLLKAIFKQLTLQSGLTSSVNEYVQMGGLNVERLLKLVNQLLTFKMMESDVLNLWIKKANLNTFIQSIIKDFTILAGEKGVKMHFLEDDEYEIYYDTDILEKVLINLLSNAIKHSPKGGVIDVIVKKNCRESVVHTYIQQANSNQILAINYIEITVSDQGDGIPDEEIKYIFERYKHSKENPERQLVDHSSIGIGLNFTRKLVELHKGFIRVENNPNEGASFSFVIPADNTPYESEMIASLHTEDSEQINDVQLTVTSVSNIQPNFNNTILVIEDDPQLNSFLRDSIKRYYKVITAFNGEDGLQIIKRKQPDLVVSDVVMPKMDGLELLKLVKESDEYCHILFILLSSRNEISAQIEGLKTGADVYVGKPFDMDFLIHTIDSQLKNRDRIHKIFLRGKMPEFKESEGNQVAMQFLARLNEILENDLSNSGLDMTYLADKLNMSRSSLYRKFVCLTSLTPIAYVRKYRINKAIELMNNYDYTIREVSDMVGFSSAAYFSTAFKQEKDISPSEYAAQQKEKFRIDTNNDLRTD